jgi:hypothetical protein
MRQFVRSYIDPLVIPQALIDAVNSPLQALVLIGLCRIDRYGLAEIQPGTFVLDYRQVIDVLQVEKSVATVRRAITELAAKQLIDFGEVELDGKQQTTLKINYPAIAISLGFLERGGDYRGGDSSNGLTGQPVNQLTGLPGKPGNQKEKEKLKQKEKEKVSRSLRPLLEAKPEFNTPQFLAVWQEWLKYRRELGKTMTPTGTRRVLSKLGSFSPAVATLAIQRSIENGWIGLFPESIAEKDLPPPQGGAPKRTSGGGFLPPVKK